MRLALVGGPMYDGMYDLLPDDVDIVVHDDHPTLNRSVAELLSRGERLDVISTHGKYTPSQSDWLRPLDDLLPPELIAAHVGRAVDLCRFDGALLCLPRNVDVRVLWYRQDLLETPPASWRDVLASGQPFGFTGRESGLFGLFFELVVGAGGALFDANHRPTMTGTLAEQAVETICALAANVDGNVVDWHYDDVDRALTEGRVAMAAAWPGATSAIRSSRLGDRLVPAPYLKGERRWVSYSGCHGWAIPQTCEDVAAAVDLILTLSSAEAAAREAAAGGMPALRSALDELVPVDEVDRQRLEIVRRTIADAMITYPSLRSFPSIEDAGWSAINLALRGSLSPADAVAQLQATAEKVIDEG